MSKPLITVISAILEEALTRHWFGFPRLVHFQMALCSPTSFILMNYHHNPRVFSRWPARFSACHFLDRTDRNGGENTDGGQKGSPLKPEDTRWTAFSFVERNLCVHISDDQFARGAVNSFVFDLFQRPPNMLTLFINTTVYCAKQTYDLVKKLD